MNEDQLSPPPHHLRPRHHNRRWADLASRTLSKPRAIIMLIIISFVLGYLAHSQPLVSQSAQDLLNHSTFSSLQCADPVPAAYVRQTVIDRVFNGTSPWEGFPPPHVNSLIMQEWTKGWGSQTPVFEHLILQAQPKIIIEVGTFLGASATHMAGLTRKLGIDAQILCIDDFRGWPGYYDGDKSLKMVNGDSLLLYQFMQNVVKANATNSIMFLPFSTSTALSGLCEWGVYGDLVEIDAAHDFHSAWTDINNAYKLLKPGGVLFGHDYAWDGVREAVHLFARLNGFRVRLDGEHWILY
ncbi:hypothetical protein Salat_0294300 [Sesamum alatum]|uniref:S-adenosyl-L-methionine-dependent methyltransferase n=1 Tax=Sesamum alatum TaxID=300844 RepID=A0AAE2CZB0_9LAMI|nr:hypothetical protein Salat_0294300 [Sesamum alatum]